MNALIIFMENNFYAQTTLSIPEKYNHNKAVLDTKVHFIKSEINAGLLLGHFDQVNRINLKRRD